MTHTTTTLMTLLTPAVGGGRAPTPSNSVTSGGNPTVDLSSDPVYLEIASIRSHRLRTESHVTAPLTSGPIASLGCNLCF